MRVPKEQGDVGKSLTFWGREPGARMQKKQEPGSCRGLKNAEEPGLAWGGGPVRARGTGRRRGGLSGGSPLGPSINDRKGGRKKQRSRTGVDMVVKHSSGWRVDSGRSCQNTQTHCRIIGAREGYYRTKRTFVRVTVGKVGITKRKTPPT